MAQFLSIFPIEQLFLSK